MSEQKYQTQNPYTDSEDPYQKLANAIVILAAKDYRTVLKELKKFAAMEREDPDQLFLGEADTLAEKASIERFFHSGWFGVLTSVDPEMLLFLLQKEAENK